MNVRLHEDVKVGVMYYVWYQNSTSDWNYPIVDEPLLDHYVSKNETVLNQHLTWIEDAGIDFIIVSWWGVDGWSGANGFRDNVTKLLFDLAAARNSRLRICLQIEPWTDLTAFQGIVNDYVFDTYVNSPRGAYYFRYHDSPLLLYYKHYNMNPDFELMKDNRFYLVATGVTTDSDWVDKNFPNIEYGSSLPRNAHWVVCPRFDETRIPFRRGYVNDSDYSYGLYQQQWEKALDFSRSGQIDVIEITTFNEYSERTMIEPHRDHTAIIGDSYYMLNLTRHYIDRLHSNVS